MNYIEQMMKTAGVEKQLDVCMRCLKEDICEYCDKKLLGEYIYPDFTAGKQLALIKQMVKDNVIGFFKITQGLSKDYILFYEGCKSQHEDFAQALAKLTTELYYSLPEAQRQEVKEILER